MTVRKLEFRKQLALIMAIAMVFSGSGPAFLRPVAVHAQTAPVGQGFVVNAGDLRFIYQQILVAQDHAAGGALLGPGPKQVADPQLPRGLRTVDGSWNNLVPIPDQHMFGTADRLFPRLLPPVVPPTALAPPLFVAAEAGTSYEQKSGTVIDSQPRVISNLIVDQSASNPAAVVAATNPCGSGGFVCSGSTDPDPASGALFIPNITPDFGLSAPYNLMFVFFGQFFDHGLDLVTKGGSGSVVMPLKDDDPLIPGPDGILGTADDLPAGQRAMVMTRGQNQPGQDGILGTADDIQETMNTTTPWVDQNQTYTSHPSHQVFLRQYYMVNGRPLPDGKMLDGGACAVRSSTALSIGGTVDEICNIGTWADVKTQAALKLGILLSDQDVLDVPVILTDPYGHFKPGPLRGMPQILTATGPVEGNLASPVAVPANAARTGHAFLNDIAHSAVPPAPPAIAVPDSDTVAGSSLDIPSPAGSYDNELLEAHFVTGDGRGNENIALTMVHNLFHAEHNRLVHYIETAIGTLTPTEQAAWRSVNDCSASDPERGATCRASGWGYGERLFQAARFVTEMEYQHLVFEEFARRVQPLVNPFLGGITSIDGAISAEFAHTVYRLGHSMLPERIARAGTAGEIRLLDAFLNPLAYNAGGTLNAAEAAGSIISGIQLQVGNELDEFVTSSVRNTLVGLPLDLPAINIARGRSEGIPRLNVARRRFFAATKDSAVQPYANWHEFGLALRHAESLVNFVAAYGTDPSITGATTLAAKRSAAQTIVAASSSGLMVAPASTSGLDLVDFWVGGMAEKPAVFGGLLGSTFNFVFEAQLERLQDGDRFYYLQRTDGLNLRFSLEGNSLAELARRNTTASGTMDIIFSTPDFTFDMATQTVPVDFGAGITLQTLTDGTILFFDSAHTGKNIVFNGTSADDRLRADVGDDTFYGNGGNDRIDGAEGNDTLLGGDGDDVLFGQNGDDIVKGGPGNDAANMGPGFGGDLAIGGDGKDFLVGGDDGDEYFGGPGNDFLLDGTTRSEGIFGGDGDDWLDAGDGHDGGLFGDGGNVFDLLAGLDFVGGDDVLDGGPGQDGHFGEGGDDIFLMSEGSNKFFGDYGFDWVSQRSSVPPQIPADIELDLLAIPGLPLNFNDLRNFYRLVDGASGWDLNDHIRGSLRVNDPAAEIERQNQPGMELTATNAAKITGLPELMAAFPQALPYREGDILIGGAGSDVIEGKAGNDLIDGDVWLDVRLRAVLNDGTVKLVTSARDLQDDVLADPQRLNPGNINIVKQIVTPVVPAADCGTAAPLNCDTAVFSGPLGEYAIVRNANGTVTVTHAGGPALPSALNNGTDILRNIEQLQFSDGTVSTAGIPTSTTGATIAGTVVVNSAGTNTLTSPAITSAAGTLFVALVSADSTAARPNGVTGVTNSGNKRTRLTWSRAVLANAQLGTAEIWWAYSAAPQTATQVSAKTTRAFAGSMTVMTFTGAAATLGGAIASASGASGTPTTSLITTGPGSWVVGVATDQGTPGVIAVPLGSNQVIVNQFSPLTGDTYWTQRTAAVTSLTGTSVAVTATPANTAGAWNLAAVEIRRQ